MNAIIIFACSAAVLLGLSVLVFAAFSLRGKARAGGALLAKAGRNGGGSGGKSGHGGDSDFRSAAASNKKAEKKPDSLVSVTIKTHHDKKGGHPHIIVDNVEDKHVSVGLSTNPKKGKNGTNYAMEKSPFDDGKKSYMRRQGTVAPKNDYAGLRKGTLTPKDYAQAKVYGDRAKQKYLAEKKDKKK